MPKWLHLSRLGLGLAVWILIGSSCVSFYGQSFDAYMLVDGIPGGASSPYTNWIKVVSFNYEATNPDRFRPNVSDITIVKPLDKSSPKLMLAGAKRTVIPKIRLLAVDRTTSNLFWEVELTHATINSYYTSGVTTNPSSSLDSNPEQISIGYASLEAYGFLDWLDSVGDGILDSWRRLYFGGTGLTTNYLSCATCDASGTGQNNQFKYIAGLDPTNSASVFTLQILPVNGQPLQKTLVLNPVYGDRAYTVEYSTNLAFDGWAPLTSLVGPLYNGTEASVTDTNAAEPRKFYRIKITQP